MFALEPISVVSSEMWTTSARGKFQVPQELRCGLVRDYCCRLRRGGLHGSN